MGMGISKLNAAEEGKGAPAKFLPSFVGRIEEFRKYKNTENTLSKKKLLKYADREDVKSRSSQSEDNVSSSKEIQTSKEETGARVIAAERLSRVVPMPNSEGKIMAENHPNKDNVEQVKRNMDPSQGKLNHVVEMVQAEVKTGEEKSARLAEEEPKKEKMQSEKGDEHDDDKDESEEVGRFICPGSPSFKIYCFDPEKINEGNRPPIITHHKARSASTVETAASKFSNESPYVGLLKFLVPSEFPSSDSINQM
ncbi:unnamed protein product [Sphenostylis stenocarpa]|uniref:Uncharacterized protein n=1 Tax=Sphenostylis stenocarpa TaxID=92480 RepID=A0AA86S0D2_9FABA|nr:unnamed protein product [Sphenostylis stenocarpa]